ncbi:MAG: helix-turn-helix transcriptional regulator [Ruminococcaceae bacterium]|nr:helix-turn-helix transcriptional regulator [Oscillospiraceae bacterium]
MSLSERIKSLRRSIHMTQTQLAEALNISEQAVSRWETAQSAPDISILPELARLLGTSTDYLLTGKDNVRYVTVTPYDLCHDRNLSVRPKVDLPRTGYNNIEVPKTFPPRGMQKIENYEPLPVPYLRRPPKVIDISIGRQLFVDDFLIEKSTFIRQYHTPRRYPGNPIFFPETELELGRNGHVAMAAPFSDGVWYDGTDGKFKMWYQAGWFDGTAYAESDDGIHFVRPDFGIDGNRVIPVTNGEMRDSCAVVLNRYYEEDRPYKMFLYNRPGGGEILDSADGIAWEKRTNTGDLGDRSTIYYNPFRKKWVYSMRTDFGAAGSFRARSYMEADTLEDGASLNDHVYWTRADRLDPVHPEIGDRPTLYNLDCIAYESVLLGAFDLFLGPENNFGNATGIPKHTELHLGWSRDGFHFHRPEVRTPFLAPNRADPESWERGYIHSNNGICIINGDELWFYYTAFKGDTTRIHRPTQEDGMYANASTGLAILRRDGFASLNAMGYRASMTTRALWFHGEYLFVNADFRSGGLRAAILDEDGKQIPGYELENCVTMSENSTKYRLTWRDHATLSELSDTVIRLQFEGVNGQLYSFWISDHEDGRSHGCLAAGEVGKKGLWDE